MVTFQVDGDWDCQWKWMGTGIVNESGWGLGLSMKVDGDEISSIKMTKWSTLKKIINLIYYFFKWLQSIYFSCI